MKKITNGDLFKILQMLPCINKITGVRVTQRMAANARLVDEIIADLQAPLKPSKEFEEYQKKHNDLVKQHAKRDDNNDYVFKDEEKTDYDIENIAALEEDIDALREEYKECLDSYDEVKREYEESLTEECDTVFYPIKDKDIPAKASFEQRNVLQYFCEDIEDMENERNALIAKKNQQGIQEPQAVEDIPTVGEEDESKRELETV